MNRPGKRVSAEKGKLTSSGGKFGFQKKTDRVRVDKTENITVSGG